MSKFSTSIIISGGLIDMSKFNSTIIICSVGGLEELNLNASITRDQMFTTSVTEEANMPLSLKKEFFFP